MLYNIVYEIIAAWRQATPHTRKRTEEVQSTDRILVYPNPTQGLLYIDLSFTADLHSYNILTHDGNLVRNTTSIKSDQIEVSDLTTGLYIMTFVNNDGKTYTQRFVKE